MSAYVPANLRRSVRADFSNRCAYCQTDESLSATLFEIEHILPRSAGGMTILQNLCLACPMCNRYKAANSSAFDPVTELVVPLFHPQRQHWKEHFSWSADGAAIIGLSATGRATVAELRMNRPAMIRVRHMWVSLGLHPPFVP
jgi:hypothetical protein